MKSIEEMQKDKEPNIFYKMLTYDWIFSTWYEKMILTLTYAFAFYSLWRLIF